MDPKNIAGRTSELARKLKDVAVAEQREMADELVTLLIEYWDLHPHSAMEMLQAVTLRLPLSLAHVQVATVVDAWKQKPNYAPTAGGNAEDRKSTRLNSSHEWISYAVFCLKKKK